MMHVTLALLQTSLSMGNQWQLRKAAIPVKVACCPTFQVSDYLVVRAQGSPTLAPNTLMVPLSVVLHLR